MKGGSGELRKEAHVSDVQASVKRMGCKSAKSLKNKKAVRGFERIPVIGEKRRRGKSLNLRG